MTLCVHCKPVYGDCFVSNFYPGPSVFRCFINKLYVYIGNIPSGASDLPLPFLVTPLIYGFLVNGQHLKRLCDHTFKNASYQKKAASLMCFF